MSALVLTALMVMALASPSGALAATRPAVTQVSPVTGPLQGGNTVTIHGRRFRANGHSLVEKVMFGKKAATKVRVRSATRITVRAPKGNGTVNVRVITTQGKSPRVAADRYTFAIQPLKVMGISPATGSTAGGTVVTISGSGFTGATTVKFGTTAASFTFVSDSAIQATAPAGKGTVDVTVTTPFGTSKISQPADQFGYYAPATVTTVSPTIGPAAGGTQVTITGTVLFSASQVWFGTTPATSFTPKSNSKIVATAPAGADTVDVTVTTPAGTTATTAADQFTYVAKIKVNAGNNQSAAAGSTVATAPSVLVTDAAGNPVAGVDVTFAVASGGGSVGGASTTTNSSGIATVGSWTLGTTVGSNTNSLTASSSLIPSASVTFNASTTAAAAAKIAYFSGDGQSATVGTAVTTAPSVLVTDAYGNPVSGTSVNFAVASGGGSVAGSPATTNASGIATVGSWTLGTTPGTNTVTASKSGLTGSPVTFTATATTGAAANIAPKAGDNQSATVGTVVATAPSVLVTDTYGNPVAGESVQFAAAPGDGSVTGASATTNSSGIATVGSWTLGTTAGTDTLKATDAGVTGSPVTFTATADPGTPTSITPVAGDNQTASAGTAVPIAPSVQVTDTYGNPVPGVSVTFAASGDGSVTGNPATTDSSGFATVGSWTLESVSGPNTLTASNADAGSVDFTATGT